MYKKKIQKEVEKNVNKSLKKKLHSTALSAQFYYYFKAKSV